MYDRPIERLQAAQSAKPHLDPRRQGPHLEAALRALHWTLENERWERDWKLACAAERLDDYARQLDDQSFEHKLVQFRLEQTHEQLKEQSLVIAQTAREEAVLRDRIRALEARVAEQDRRRACTVTETCWHQNEIERSVERRTQMVGRHPSQAIQAGTVYGSADAGCSGEGRESDMHETLTTLAGDMNQLKKSLTGHCLDLKRDIATLSASLTRQRRRGTLRGPATAWRGDS